MKRNNQVKRWVAAISSLIFGLAACSTMSLKQYPEPPMNSFINSGSVNGVYAVAQPLLDEKTSKECFGVNLQQKEIMAVYLSVKNNNPNASFIIPAESIYISEIEANDLGNSPEKDVQEVGQALNICALPFSPVLPFILGVQQLSDAAIIKENFEAKRFRTKTIDPGQIASGFSYFNWEYLKELDNANVCFKLINPVADKSFTFCKNINLRR